MSRYEVSRTADGKFKSVWTSLDHARIEASVKAARKQASFSIWNEGRYELVYWDNGEVHYTKTLEGLR